MKKILLIALLFVSFSAKAQLLWEISGNGLQKPSYIYGTMHVSDMRVFEFDSMVLPKFEQCDAFAGEMIFDQNMMMSMMDLLFMKDTTLADLLAPDQYSYVKKYLDKNLGFMAGMSQRFKPIFTSVFITEKSSADQKNSVSSGLPLDIYFQQLAQEKKKELIGLETFNEQVEAFNSIPLKMQARMLYEEIKELDSTKTDNSLDRLIDLYVSGDLDSLYSYSSGQFSKDINDKLLTIRNQKMAGRIDKLIKTRSLFIGIGAAHLPANEGVMELLRKKGYLVKPLSKKREK